MESFKESILSPLVTAKSQAGGPSPPARNEDVSRAASTRVGIIFSNTAAIFMHRTKDRSLGQQAWFLQFRVEVGRRGCVVDHVAKEVVTTGAVATTTTD